MDGVEFCSHDTKDPISVSGNGSIIIGPVSGKRDEAISYILEDACIHLGHLTSLRPERNTTLPEQRVQQPEDILGNDTYLAGQSDLSDEKQDKKETYSGSVLKEFNDKYVEDMPAYKPKGEFNMLLYDVVR